MEELRDRKCRSKRKGIKGILEKGEMEVKE